MASKLNITLDEITAIFASVEQSLQEDENFKNTLDMTSVFIFENQVMKKIISKIGESGVKKSCSENS